MPSTIEWTDETWNPVVGCSLISPGCTNCYAMKMAARLEAIGVTHYLGTTHKTKGGAVWTGKIRVAPGHVIRQPLAWRKPRRIFVNSMSDLFHEDVSFETVDRVFAVAALTPQHTYQILTKRPDRMAEYVSDIHGEGLARLMLTKVDHQTGRRALLDLIEADRLVRPLPHVLLGVSVEDKVRADQRRAPMAQIAAAGWTTFVSYEPALGEVDWTGWEFLRWLIAGGESGPNARPPHPGWFRIARDWCAENGVAFFFKQWGSWARDPDLDRHFISSDTTRPMGTVERLQATDGDYAVAWERLDHDGVHALGTQLKRIGKKPAGRLLDGIEHNGMPGLSA